MGVYEARGTLVKAMKQLGSAWVETKVSWNDIQSKQFEERTIIPLEQDLKNAFGAMDHMAVLLSAIQRECE